MADAVIVPSFRFAAQVAARSGQPIDLCYQCKKCAGGCPVSMAMAPMCSDILRLIQLGEREKVLASDAIWLCIGCRTCAARCPNGIDASRVMDALREMALAEGTAGGGRKARAFHAAFLASVEKLGRAYEAGVISLYKLKTASFGEDLGLGLKLLARRKLKLLPSRVRRIEEIRRIFKAAKTAEAEAAAEAAAKAEAGAAGAKAPAGAGHQEAKR